MSDWKEFRLGELATVIPGYAFKGKDFGNDGCRVVKIGDITPPIVDVANCLKIPTNKINGLDKFKLTKGDFVLAMTGATLGKVGKYSSGETGYINQRVAKFENITGISDKRFLYYLITSNYVSNEIINRGLGSAQPNISGKDIESINVVAPNLPTQTAIAEILSSLDDKIELNNKINQELENLAQTLFKRWFIDFEFPNENGEPYKSSGGEMVDSELGEIPKGWTVEELSIATKIIRGISYRKPELVLKGEGIPFVNLKCFSINGSFRQDGIKYFNGKYRAEHILCSNDILVAVTDLTQDREIIGMPILWNGSTTALPSLDTCVIRSQTQELKNYLYYEFKTKRYKSRIIEYANGSTVLHLSVKGLDSYVFPMPTNEILKKWSSIIQPLLETINININDKVEMSKMRDTLLPKLISGELEINQTTN